MKITCLFPLLLLITISVVSSRSFGDYDYESSDAHVMNRNGRLNRRRNSGTSQISPIVRYLYRNDNRGTYTFEYESDDGTKRSESRSIVNGRPVTVGEYSWISPDGIPFLVTYTADENGYYPRIASHLPTPPPTTVTHENLNFPSIVQNVANPPSNSGQDDTIYDIMDSSTTDESSFSDYDDVPVLPDESPSVVPTQPPTSVTSTHSPHSLSSSSDLASNHFSVIDAPLVPILVGPPAAVSPLRTRVQTSHFTIDSDNSRTSVSIGKS